MSDIVIHENPTSETEAIEELQEQGILVQLSDEQKEKIRSKAAAVVASFTDLRPQSREFQERVDAIHNLAADEIHLAGEGATRLLSKRSATGRNAKSAGNEVALRTHDTLSDLSTVMTDMKGRDSKFFGLVPIPVQKRIERMARNHQTAQEKLEHIDEALHQSEDELNMDSAALQIEQQDLRVAMAKLRENIELAEVMDGELSAQIEALRANGQDAQADAVETSMLVALRQRKHDMSVQMGVAAQSFMTMGIIRANNQELAQGVKRARNSTMNVLRNSMAIAEALATQERVLSSVEALDKHANDTMLANAAALKSQAGRIYQRSSRSGITAETLEASFNDVFATVESINQVKSKAVSEITAQEAKLRNMLAGIAPRVQQLALSSGEDTTKAQRYELTVD